MRPPAPDTRLLSSLLSRDAALISSLQSLLTSAHASHAALSAYASAAPHPHVVQSAEAALREVLEGVRAVQESVEMWVGEMREVKELEEGVRSVLRDRDILVGRLIKATKSRSSLSILPNHSPTASASSLTGGPSSALTHAQSELAACEAHLAQRQRALDQLTRQAFARGMGKRAEALEVLGKGCERAGRGVREALWQGDSPYPRDKPLPNPSPYPSLNPTHPNPTHQPHRPRSSTPDSSLSPSQSASQLDHSQNQRLYSTYPAPPSQSQLTHRLSIHVPAAHLVGTTSSQAYIPHSAVELLPQPPPSQSQVRQSYIPEEPASSSEDERVGPLIEMTNPPRTSLALSFQPPLPIQIPTPHSPHISSDIGPARSRTTALPNFRRRPSSRSLDSYTPAGPSTPRKKGFFSSIARAFRFGGGSGRASPPYGAGSGGSGRGGREKGWSTRTDGVLARQRTRRGSGSSDEDGDGRRVAVVDNRSNLGMGTVVPAVNTLGRSGMNGATASRSGTMNGRPRELGGMPTSGSDGTGRGKKTGTGTGTKKRTSKLVKRDSSGGVPTLGTLGTLGTPARARTMSGPAPGLGSGQGSPSRSRTMSGGSGLVTTGAAGAAGSMRTGTMKSSSSAAKPALTSGTSGALSRNSTVKSNHTAKSTSTSPSSPPTHLHPPPPPLPNTNTSARLSSQSQRGQLMGDPGRSIMSVLEPPPQAPGNVGKGVPQPLVNPPPRDVQLPLARSGTMKSAKSGTGGAAKKAPAPGPGSKMLEIHAPAPIMPQSRLLSVTAPAPVSQTLSQSQSQSQSQSPASSSSPTHHNPYPSASVPPPTRSALRSPSPKPVSPPQSTLLAHPARKQQQQQQQQPPRPPSAVSTMNGDDASDVYESALSDGETDTETEAPLPISHSQTQTQNNTSTNSSQHTRGPSMSSASDDTEVAAAPVARRKSVRLDVPPSLPSTPAPADSYPSPTSFFPQTISSSSSPPQPKPTPLPAQESWSSRRSTRAAADSSDEDEEYARVRASLASVNRAYEHAGDVLKPRRSTTRR